MIISTNAHFSKALGYAHQSVNKEFVSYCKSIAAAAPNLPFYYYHIPPLNKIHNEIKGNMNAPGENASKNGHIPVQKTANKKMRGTNPKNKLANARLGMANIRMEGARMDEN